MQPTERLLPGSQLTKREQEVLELVSLGLTNGEIARQLSLSRRTVETHVERIRAKLGAPTRMRAVVEAGRARLLRGPVGDPADRLHNLPVQVTTFVGRTTELMEVKALLKESRLVTIVGTGGVGKTRFAVQVAAELLDTYPHGVWLADLSKISAADAVASEVAFALGVKPQAFSEIIDHVLAYLKRKQLLLIVDNFEHVGAEAARVVSEILRRCSGVTILGTGRENLRTPGEHVYRLGSLDLPDRDNLSAEEALQFSAVSLFVARARAADAHFRLTDADAGAVAQVCRRLGGIALALELAAARVTALNLHQIVERLHDQIWLLVSKDRATPERHQTMRATLDWSYKLLHDEEQRLFRGLAIFNGGWTFEAAAAVAGTFVDESAVFEMLSSLIDKSLVAVDFRSKSQRYRLLEPVRQYAVGLLRAHDEFDSVALSHVVYFGEFAGRTNEQWLHVDEAARLLSIEEEIDNIRGALEWSLAARNNTSLGAQLAASLWTFWFARHQHEGLRWLDAAQSATSYGTESALSISIALARARIFMATDIGAMLLACEQALAPARSLQNPALLIRTVFYYGVALEVANRLEDAGPVLDEALTLTQRFGDDYRAACTLAFQSKRFRKLREYGAARAASKRRVEIYRRVSMPFDPNAGIMLAEDACMAYMDGDLVTAIRFSRASLDAARLLNDPSTAIHAEYGLAGFLVLSREIDEALSHAVSILKTSREQLFPYGVGPAFQILAGVATARGDIERAAQLLGYAHARFAQQRIPPDALVSVDAGWFVAPLRARLDERKLGALMAEGAAWSEDQAVREAAPLGLDE